jgi:hypothetical protein
MPTLDERACARAAGGRVSSRPGRPCNDAVIVRVLGVGRRLETLGVDGGPGEPLDQLRRIVPVK